MINAIIIIVTMGVLARMSGGGFGAHRLPDWLTWLPEAIFALIIGYSVSLSVPLEFFTMIIPADYVHLDLVFKCFFIMLFSQWSFAWMQTGHANALPWGDGTHNPDRTNTLSPVIKKLSDWLGIEYYSVGYARLFMAVKGFLIGLPLGGIPLAILWPLGYEIGWFFRGRVKFDPHAISEFCAGAGVGISIVIFKTMIG